MAFENEAAPNTAERHQGRLAYIDDKFLPRNVLPPLWEKAQESSLVMRLGQRIPVSYGESVLPLSAVEPEVGQVGVGTRPQDREGHQKPVTGVAWDSTTFSPIKLAGIITVSEEFATVDPRGLNSQLRGKLASAIGRGLDLAVFHGRRPDNGDALQGIDANSYVNATTKRVYLDADTATSVKDDMIAGWELVTTAEHDVNGWAIDKLFQPKILGATDKDGKNVFGGEVDLSGAARSLLGLPVEYGKAVSGKLGAAARTNVRLFGGDWTRVLYGFADRVRIKRSTEAVITDAAGNTINLWQTNQVALMVEVTVGWKVDPEAFFALETGTPPAP
ncbi:phage major capsid protein [Amycolatopsis cihanbeyliensis]|uniref:HK97 family phage major capsid protein n=1 Tax=Amycolatopsis cihanbeyliensis TaxID=1128664 RepID=A0A542DNK1_AMYCI|nr:phage major capsid protein [Amycolatopsis cihanbeyliensis]TQJ04689.1 HK97 family phage major capsid protein [Amycolatopsis cihanbeyliensis]